MRINCIAGIDFLEPGYKKIRIAPRPYGNPTEAGRTYRCGYGEIENSWKLVENGDFSRGHDQKPSEGV